MFFDLKRVWIERIGKKHPVGSVAASEKHTLPIIHSVMGIAKRIQVFSSAYQSPNV